MQCKKSGIKIQVFRSYVLDTGTRVHFKMTYCNLSIYQSIYNGWTTNVPKIQKPHTQKNKTKPHQLEDSKASKQLNNAERGQFVSKLLNTVITKLEGGTKEEPYEIYDSVTGHFSR